MENLVPNAAFDLNCMPQDSPKTSTKHKDDDKNEDEFFYMLKIEELVKEKWKLFAGENESKKSKAGSKRKRSSGENKKKKVVHKRVVRKSVVHNEMTERLKEFITNEMNGWDMKLVIQKPLYESDLARGQNRLNIPINQVLAHDFLTADEKIFLKKADKNDKGDKKINEIGVRLVGPNLQMYEKPMALKIWTMPKTKNYVLMSNWNKFVKDNEDYLQKDSTIQVWSFRRDQQLCFALAVVERPGGENDFA